MLNGMRRHELVDQAKFPHIKSLKSANDLRCEIINKIKSGTFTYLEYFPNSKRVNLGLLTSPSKQIYCRELLEKVLLEYEGIHENGDLSISTLVGYRKIIKNPLMPYFGGHLIQEVSSTTIRGFVEAMGTTAKRMPNNLRKFWGVLMAKSGNHWRHRSQMRSRTLKANALCCNDLNGFYNIY